MKKIFVFLFLSAITTSLYSQSISDKIKTAYTVFSKDSQLKYGITSLVVTEQKTDRQIFAANGDVGLAPASSLKTITAATALAVLGEDYQFKTDVVYSGKVINGVLQGDIIVKGNGDPTLGSNRYKTTEKSLVLDKILLAVKNLGINSIEGKIIVDDAIWDSQSLPQGWIWQDMGNYYGAGTSAVCWRENEFELTLKPSQTVGGAVEIINKDKICPFLNLHNELLTGADGSGDKVYGYSAPYTSEVYLRGTYARNLKKNIRFSLPDAALAMAFELYQHLQQNEVYSKGYTTSRILKQQAVAVNLSGTPLLVIHSPALKDIIYFFNQKSINLYGEQLVRAMANESGNKIEDGIKFIQNYWTTREVDKRSLNIIDGSGLSPANRITASTMVNILRQAEKEAWFPAYLESLPLNNGMKMKSGTIGDVLAYAGYHNGYCFTVMVNNYSGSTSEMRQKIFKMLNALK